MFESCKQTLKIYEIAKVTPTVPLISTLLKALGLKAVCRTILHVFRILKWMLLQSLDWIRTSKIELNMFDRNMVLRMFALQRLGLGSGQSVDEHDNSAELFYTQMRKDGLEPTLHTFNSLLISACRRLDVQRSRQVRHYWTGDS